MNYFCSIISRFSLTAIIQFQSSYAFPCPSMRLFVLYSLATNRRLFAAVVYDAYTSLQFHDPILNALHTGYHVLRMGKNNVRTLQVAS
jgi:hypothetical protein